MHIPAFDVFRPVHAPGHDVFVQGKDSRASQQAGDKIGEAEPPQTYSRRAHGRQFMVPRVVGERVEDRQQQGDGQNQHQESRQDGQAVLRHLQQVQLALLQFPQFSKQAETGSQNDQPAEAERQRGEQFAE